MVAHLSNQSLVAILSIRHVLTLTLELSSQALPFCVRGAEWSPELGP